MGTSDLVFSSIVRGLVALVEQLVTIAFHFLPCSERRAPNHLHVYIVCVCVSACLLHVYRITVPSFGLHVEATCSMTPGVLNLFLSGCGVFFSDFGLFTIAQWFSHCAVCWSMPPAQLPISYSLM